MSDIVIFIFGAASGILAWLVILLFMYLIRIGKQTRRSVFVITMTILMAIYGLVTGLIDNSGLSLVIVLTLSLGAIGAMISLIVSLVLYNHKRATE